VPVGVYNGYTLSNHDLHTRGCEQHVVLISICTLHVYCTDLLVYADELAGLYYITTYLGNKAMSDPALIHSDLNHFNSVAVKMY